MKPLELKIDGVSYSLKFGHKSYKLILKEWGLTKISEIGKALGKLNFKEGVEPDVNQFDKIGDIVFAGVLHGNDTVTIDRDDCVDYLYHNAGSMKKIIGLFIGSFPTPPNPEKGKK